MAKIIKGGKVLISGLCFACNKEFSIEELRQEKNIYVVVDVKTFDIKETYHSHCRKLEKGMITLKEYLKTHLKKHPVEVFLEKFRERLGITFTKDYYDPKECLDNFMTIAVKWMEGSDLKKVAVEECVIWFITDLRESTESGDGLKGFYENYNLKKHLMDKELQNWANELEKKKKKQLTMK